MRIQRKINKFFDYVIDNYKEILKNVISAVLMLPLLLLAYFALYLLLVIVC